MKASEISARRNRIVELLQERGTLSIKEAVRLLDVSHETIRQDFNHLEQQGLSKGPLHHRLGQWQHRCSFGIKACGSLS